ncbi:MAG: TRAP transporter large permease subunit [Acidobacteria bacterium]|nr:TRAP transporter large permease subunit [Acidobacteriota bacterium]
MATASITADPAASNSIAVRFENSIALIAMAGIIVIPLAEIVLRKWFATGIPGAAPFAQHLTMWVGMLGAAIAARDGKLLSLATGEFLAHSRTADIAKFGAALVGSAVATVFAVGGINLVTLDRVDGTEIAAGVPVWVADLVLPIAFGLIAARLLWRASSSWALRAVALVGPVAGYWLATHPELLDGAAVWPWLVVLVFAALIGAPIFVLLGGAAAVLFMAQGSKPTVLLITAYQELTGSAGLATIPLFTLAGYLLAEGKSSERLLRLFRGLFGWLPGGIAVATVALCAFFTLLTGGSGVTILALGGLLLPALLKEGYGQRFSIGLLTSGGSLGLLFPRSLPLILYAIIANQSMEDLFIGGLLPGILMLVMLSAYAVRHAIRSGAARSPFVAKEAGAALWNAKWEIGLPVVVMTVLLGGYATPVESAAVAALYAFIMQRFIHRDIPSMREVVKVTADSVGLVGGVLIILAVAVGLTNYMINAQIPDALIAWTTEHIESPLMFLLALNVFLLLVGCVMDVFSAIVVVVPLISGVAEAYQIDPIHLGIIFVANLELGYLTPPLGLNLLVASVRFERPALEVMRAALPMLAILTIAVLVITYFPWLTLAPLQWFGRGGY